MDEVTPNAVESPLAGESPNGNEGSYLLGSSPAETARLIYQGGVFRPLTEWLFRAAGLRAGMRVLDLGSGAGDVAMLAADLVGGDGEVVGVDSDPNVLGFARDRAKSAGLANISFVEGDFRTLELPGTFDALVGRFILMYLPEPAAVIHALRPRLRPGAVIAFHEMDFYEPIVVPAQPLVTQAYGWWNATLARAGIEARMGPKLYATFTAAGLPAPKMMAETIISGGTESPVPVMLAEAIRTVLPAMGRFGITTREEVGVDTLADRLRAEVVAGDGCIAAPMLIGAWTRIH